MSQLVKIADIASAVTAQGPVTMIGSGAFRSATFWVQTAAGASTTSDWTVSLYWHSPTSTATTNSDQVATLTGLDATATALVEIPKVAPFLAGVNDAIPRPNMYTLTRTGGSNATSPIAGEIWAAFAD